MLDLDLDLLDEENPFEVDRAHLFKHAPLGIDDVREVWQADPLFYPAKPLRGVEAARRPVPEGPMSPSKRSKMTRQEEYEFYARPENQEPQGPARRRAARLTEMVPVRFPAETLEEVRRRADADDRSVSGWIRRAVEHELERDAG